MLEVALVVRGCVSVVAETWVRGFCAATIDVRDVMIRAYQEVYTIGSKFILVLFQPGAEFIRFGKQKS